MIIKPDFLDHYKTRKLCNLLNEDMAPLYLIRLWGFCEMRKSALIPDDEENIKAVCQYKGKAKKLVKVLISSGFLKREKTEFIVHDWEEYNQGLMTSYENGRKGGRPKGKQVIPRETHGKPTGLPQDNPNAIPVNPLVTVQSREEKSREEEEAAPPPTGIISEIPEVIPEGILEQVILIKKIRPEFAQLRDVDIENAIKGCPEEYREDGIRDFVRDMAESLAVPDMPIKKLRAYLEVAARGGSKSAGGGRSWDNEDVTDAEKNVEKAYLALAKIGA